MDALRLPRKLNDDPVAAHLVSEISARAEPLWAGAELCATEVEIGPGLLDALKSAQSAGRIVRGLEGAERALTADELGLRHADEKAGVQRGGRISRLVVVTNDGSERFYRNVESLLRRHAPRVLALRLATGEGALGDFMFGPEQRARLLLVEHKDASAPGSYRLLPPAGRPGRPASTGWLTYWNLSDAAGRGGEAAYSSYLAGSGFAGYTDWSIPNIRELQNIVSYEVYGPAIDSPFHKVATCTGCTDVTQAAWTVHPRFV